MKVFINEVMGIERLLVHSNKIAGYMGTKHKVFKQKYLFA